MDENCFWEVLGTGINTLSFQGLDPDRVEFPTSHTGGASKIFVGIKYDMRETKEVPTRCEIYLRLNDQKSAPVNEYTIGYVEDANVFHGMYGTLHIYVFGYVAQFLINTGTAILFDYLLHHGLCLKSKSISVRQCSLKCGGGQGRLNSPFPVPFNPDFRPLFFFLPPLRAFSIAKYAQCCVIPPISPSSHSLYSHLPYPFAPFSPELHPLHYNTLCINR